MAHVPHFGGTCRTGTRSSKAARLQRLADQHSLPPCGALTATARGMRRLNVLELVGEYAKYLIIARIS